MSPRLQRMHSLTSPWTMPQLNGAFGHDFSEPAGIDQSIRAVAKGILAHGCTAFLPTVITSPSANYRTILPHLVPRAGSVHCSSLV